MYVTMSSTYSPRTIFCCIAGLMGRCSPRAVSMTKVLPVCAATDNSASALIFENPKTRSIGEIDPLSWNPQSFEANSSIVRKQPD